MKKSIGKQFTAIIILAAVIVSVSGSLLTWKIFSVQKQQTIELQAEVGKRVKNEFVILAQELEHRFIIFSKLFDLLNLPHDQQNNVLSNIRSLKYKIHHDFIDEVVLLDNLGKIISSSSRIRLFADQQDYSWPAIMEQFNTPSSENRTYFSPVSVTDDGEPFMVFAVPLINYQTGEVTGGLASRIRINQVLEEIVSKPVGQNGTIYITDQHGRIISHPNPSIVLKGVVAEIRSPNHFQHGLEGEKSIRIVKNVTIGNQIFFVVVDRPVDETLTLTRQLLISLIVFLLFFLGAGAANALFFRKKIIKPIELLARTAQQVRGGNLTCMSTIDSDDELGLLAGSFNAMTLQLTTEIAKLQKTEDALKQSQVELESKVDERTTELRKLLEFSQILTSTTDLHSLYRQCVALPKTLLNLDFSTLMLLSEDKKALVIHDTIGFPESTINTLSLLEGQGLSTYVVQQKKPATVLNFKKESRFEIPPIVFTKNITSALCVPMKIGDEVFGIFIGHTHDERCFHEDEISLYQSLANQAAVAIDNAIHLKNLHESEKKFRDFFDNANDAILVYNMNGAVLEVNNVTCQRLGYSRDEILSLTPNKFIAPQFSQTIQDRIKTVSENQKEIFETAHITSNGEEIPIELSCTHIKFEGQPAILGIARDISERKRMEEELLKNRKLESVGVLAGGIAHDFNNFLTAIIGNINLASLQINPQDSAHELLLLAEKAAFRAKDLTQQLLTFSKGGEPVKHLTSIDEIIKDSADFILRGSTIKCHYAFAEHIWPVEIDASQISQVIQNIILNACHVMPEGGCIEITCENIKKQDAVNLSLQEGDYVKISIKDEGPGIPTKQLSNIFDPYFTTKEQGSGLGLAITHSIITKHGGVISANSPKGQGAIFTIFLKASPHAKLEKQQAPKLSAKGGKGKVMVMDDDDMIRNFSDKMLCHAGYEVVLAANGHEAIDLYTENYHSAAEIDAIIMDLTIPGGMGGKDAVKAIHQVNPQAKVIVSSGYSNDPIMANYRDYGFCAAISKPYQRENLLKVVEQVLA